MIGDKPADRGLRDLHDSVLRVLDFRDARGLVDADSSGSSSYSSISNNISSGGRTGVLSAVCSIHRRSVIKGTEGVFSADNRGISRQHAPE